MESCIRIEIWHTNLGVSIFLVFWILIYSLREVILLHLINDKQNFAVHDFRGERPME